MWTSINPTYDEEVICEKSNECTLQILKINNKNKARAILEDTVAIVQAEDLGYIQGDVKVIDYKETIVIKNLKELLVGSKYSLMPHSKMILKGKGYIEFKETTRPLIMMELMDEEIIIWDDMLYCLEGDISVKEFTEEINLIDEEFTEEVDLIKLVGSGLVILKLPVLNCDEIIKSKIFKNKIISYNNYVILRSNKIVAKSEYFGEHKVNAYSGIGEIWQVPKEYMCIEKVLEDTEEKSNNH